MYSFIIRFLRHPDPAIIASLDPILGGPGWQNRLDPKLEPAAAVEQLFRNTLKTAGNFQHVISTRIDKSVADQPHFFLAYGTKDRAGLLAFRDIEYKALREHARNRAAAKGRKRESKTGSADLFPDFEMDVQEASVDDVVANQKVAATAHLVGTLRELKSMKFESVVDILLEAFMLRETNVKDICVEMWRGGIIANTWGPTNRKPTDETLIKLL